MGEAETFDVIVVGSGEDGFVNGQTIAVDGGLSATRDLAPAAIGVVRG